MSRILLIDDDEMTLMMLRAILTDAGYTVTATADGPRGIDLYKELRPELVLLDIGLPGMSGMQVLRELRRFDPEANVIVISGYTSQASVREAMKNGARKFLEKPVDGKKLVETVRQSLMNLQ
jgi:two-component system chemotaxis response regulator CheY